MIEMNIPGRGVVKLEHLVCDVNGTLALDGQLPPEIPIRLRNLRDRLAIHMLTADTHGQQTAIDQQLGLQTVRIDPGAEGAKKADYILQLGADTVVAIGQGANDAGMLKAAAVGICLLSPEGAAIETLLNADLVVPDIQNAFELLDKPLRIVATLRK